MTIFDRRTRYGRISIFNHWLIAVLVILNLGIGLTMDDSPENPGVFSLFWLHISIGVAVLIFGLWRVLWRALFRFPEPVAAMPRWQERAALGVHIALLAVILAMPVTGYMAASMSGENVGFFGLFALPSLPQVKWLAEIAEGIHGLLANVLIALLAVHILAAIKHHVIDKDATLDRMLGRDREEAAS